MKKTIYTIALGGLFAVGLNACGNEEKKKETVKTEEVATEKTCTYNLDAATVKVNWTAFKLTEKKGVGGTFDNVTISGTSESESVLGAVENATFEIQTATVNSDNPPRDLKIANSFFGTMENTELISGKIVSLEENGTGVVLLKMNNVEKEVEIQWVNSEENKFTLTTTINVPDWNAQASLDSINNVCSLKHTGEDGLSVTWPDVDISVEAIITKICE